MVSVLPCKNMSSICKQKQKCPFNLTYICLWDDKSGAESTNIYIYTHLAANVYNKYVYTYDTGIML